MWKKFIKDYLSFSKKDRIGVIVLLSLILIVLLLPYCWPKPASKQLPKEELIKIQALAAKLQQGDSVQQEAFVATHDYRSSGNYNNSSHNTALFYFDPNSLNEAGWQKLGLRDKTIATIQHYLAKGGRFKKPEDIGRIYGLQQSLYEKLLPYVRIASNAPLPHESIESNKNEITEKPVYTNKPATVFKSIEINSADTTAFIALPGIGSKLAARIVNFRDKLGGFYAVEQLAETYGLPDSTFSKIKTSLHCNAASVKVININTADANTLKLHPYIRWNLANAIVQYRQQHGNFKSVDDLQAISIITPEMFQKMRPYVTVE
ncbi:MAG: helix-hairpin-helix domain-containing protein [Chitinophagaceae bacterium]